MPLPDESGRLARRHLDGQIGLLYRDAAACDRSTFVGGCITYQFSFTAGAAPSLAIFVDQAVTCEPRSVLTGTRRMGPLMGSMPEMPRPGIVANSQAAP